MSILFCTPCYGRQTTQPHHDSCMRLKDELNAAGFEHDWLSGRNDSLINRIRMEMTGAALTTDFRYMMWIDGDIEFTADDVGKLWALQTDIAVAAYSMKRPDQPLSAWKDGKLVRLEDCGPNPFPVDLAGTGFMLIKMDAVRKIAAYLVKIEEDCKALVGRLKNDAAPAEAVLLDRMLEGVAASYMGNERRVPAMYMTPVHNDGLESEDYHFCRLAREAGFKVIMDPSIRLGHWGMFRFGA